MDRRALDTYVTRARAILAETPPETATETWTWLVAPFLSSLDWDVESGRCETERTVRGVDLAAVLSVELDVETPALFVAVEAAETSLRTDGEDRLLRAMVETGVDRGIYTNGRRFVLLSGGDGEDRLAIDLDAVADHERALAAFSPRAIERRLGGNDGELVGRRLAVARDALAPSIADELVSVAGVTNREELIASTTQFLDELIDWFAERPSGRSTEGAPADGASAAEPPDSAGDESTAIARGEPRERHSTTVTQPSSEEGSPTGTHAGGRETSSSEPDRSSPPESRPRSDASDGSADGEYVVRFFNERGSIGGVGHSNPALAIAAAAEFCFERGLSGIRVPWRADDDGEVVLHEEPVLADGSPMLAYQQLSNGLYLNTAGDPDELAERVTAFAERINLRAMVRGDWSAEE